MWPIFTEQLNLTRRKAVILATISMFILGIAASLSWGAMSNVKIFGLNIFSLFNNTTANILLPLGGLLDSNIPWMVLPLKECQG